MSEKEIKASVTPVDEDENKIDFSSDWNNDNKHFVETKKQLDSWGLKYHLLILGKPTYDILVDDKHIGFSRSWTKDITKLL